MTIEKAQIVDVKEFTKTSYYFRNDGLVVIRIRPNVHLELEDSIAEQRYMHEHKAEYLPMRVMIVPGDGASVSKEVRDYSNHPDNTKMIRAEAIVVNSLAHKIMANFIKNFYKTPMPLKIFNNEEKAIDWLLNHD